MKLFTLIKTPDHNWLMPSWHGHFNLPTEVVVDEPRFVTPKQGRYFEIDLYERDGELIPYRQLAAKPDFKGTAHETQVYLYEVWEDWGDDGHVVYSLMGWTLTPGKQDNPHRLLDLIHEKAEANS